ncbi:Hypothetical predicted protein [Podarcis lilfordi]|nr:Hypothetical predicted protein [Podarcis lilfordi]
MLPIRCVGLFRREVLRYHSPRPLAIFWRLERRKSCNEPTQREEKTLPSHGPERRIPERRKGALIG